MDSSKSLGEDQPRAPEVRAAVASSGGDDALPQRGWARLSSLRESQLDPFSNHDGDNDESYSSSTYCGSNPSNVTQEPSDLDEASNRTKEPSDLDEASNATEEASDFEFDFDDY